MARETPLAMKRLLSLAVLIVVSLALPLCVCAQPYQKRLAVQHTGAFTPTSLVYSGMYNGNACVVTGSDIILFNPLAGTIVGKNVFSIPGNYFHITAVYQQGSVVYCTAINADAVQEVGCLMKYDLATNTILWQKKIYVPGKIALLNAISGDGDTSIFMAGTVYDTAISKNDILLIKASTDGNIIWTRNVGVDTLDEVPSSICFHSNREIYISGTSYAMAAQGRSVIFRYDNLGNFLNANAAYNSGTSARPSKVFSGIINGKLYTVDRTILGPSDAGPAIIRVFDSSLNLLSSVAKSGLSPGNIFVDGMHILVTGQAPITYGLPGFRTIRFDTGLNVVGSRYFHKIPTSSMATSSTCFIDSANQSLHFFKDGGNDTFYVIKADSTEYVGCLDTIFAPGTPAISSVVVPYPAVSATVSVLSAGITVSQYDATITTFNVCPFPEMVYPVSSESNISLFPNPCHGVLSINMAGNTFGNGLVNFRLMTVDGKIALASTATPDANGMLQIDISHLPPGLYFCEVSNEKGVARDKVILH